jgi:DNA-binding NtrC family response regulator
METKANAPNIMVVDDEIGPRESLRMILKPYFNVSTVESGDKAIESAKRIEFDVVTLDSRCQGCRE